MATYTLKIENGDFVRSLGGEARDSGFATVTGSDKYAQDVRGLLNTNRSGLPQLVGLEANPFEARAQVSQAVGKALEALRNVQRSRQYSQRSRAERHAGIRRLDVRPRKTDPRRYIFSLETFSEAGAIVLSRINARGINGQ